MAKDWAEALRPEDLITLNRSVTVARLLSGVAHEVNNALQVIGGIAELLQYSPDVPAPVLEGLQRIEAQGTRAASALADVIAFSRQKGDMRGAVNMREIVTRAIALRSYAIGRARLTIAPHVQTEVGVNVHGSAPLLQQALLNLIVNAEDALAGRPGGAISVDLERDNAWVQLRVLDDGPGVDSSLAATMFDAFVTTKPRDESSGLGLTVARAIAELHEGTLAHEAGKAGASFVMRIPAGN